MNIIKQRRQNRRDFHSSDYDQQRLREVTQETCGVCADRWPASMMLTEDGKRRCPDCSDNGKSQEERAEILNYDAARIQERQTRPQIDMGRGINRTFSGTIISIKDSNGVSITQSNPLYLTAGGASKTLTCAGSGFASSDTVSGSTGVTVTKSVDSASQVTLTCSADGGTAAGDYYHLTYNGTTIRGLFRVR